MTSRRAGPLSVHWEVRSVWVRKRDGPHRLEQAYRNLLGDREQGAGATRGEAADASGHLREGVA